MGSRCHFSFSSSNQSYISSNKSLESGSFWVEGVLEMGRSNTKSDLGVSESGIDLFVEFMMLGSSPSVFFVLRTEFEVEISDEILEAVTNSFIGPSV